MRQAACFVVALGAVSGVNAAGSTGAQGGTPVQEATFSSPATALTQKRAKALTSDARAPGHGALLRREDSTKYQSSLVEAEAEVMTPQYWCGGHWAKSCGECTKESGSKIPGGSFAAKEMGKSWCNGDCEWDDDNGECGFRAELLWCGAHAAITCNECVWDTSEAGAQVFRGKSWCNGECYWLESNGLPGQCFSKYPNAPTVPRKPPAGLNKHAITSLTEDALAGSNKLSVALTDVTVMFPVSHEIYIGSPPTGETKRIAGAHGSALVLETELLNNHRSGATVQGVGDAASALKLPYHPSAKIQRRREAQAARSNINISNVKFTPTMDANMSNCLTADILLHDANKDMAWALYLALATFVSATVTLGCLCALCTLGTVSEEEDDRQNAAYVQEVKDGSIKLPKCQVPEDPNQPIEGDTTGGVRPDALAVT